MDIEECIMKSKFNLFRYYDYKLIKYGTKIAVLYKNYICISEISFCRSTYSDYKYYDI